MSNASIAASAIYSFFNALIKACSSTIGPRNVLITRAVGLILSNSSAPYRALLIRWLRREFNGWNVPTYAISAVLRPEFF
jgi:hypothetical protein